jgi:DNA mismatch endonuclease (patch repair protein)
MGSKSDEEDAGRLDPLTKKERSERMSRVKNKDTEPEMAVRRLIYGMGYRYRLHVSSLPGKPDLVFKGRRKVIFVHGCFWHLHDECKSYNLPKSRTDFWMPKLKRNRERDEENIAALEDAGWEVLVIWECQINDLEDVSARVRQFLEDDR